METENRLFSKPFDGSYRLYIRSCFDVRKSIHRKLLAFTNFTVDCHICLICLGTFVFSKSRLCEGLQLVELLLEKYCSKAVSTVDKIVEGSLLWRPTKYVFP